MPLLEQDALFLTSNFDQFDAEKQAAAKDWLQRYKQQQADEGEPLFPSVVTRQVEQENNLRRMFEAPDKIDYDPGYTSADPLHDKMQHANMAFLASRYQKEPAEVASRYDFLLNDYARQKLGASEDVDTAKFYALAQKDMQRVKLREDTQREGMSAALRGEDGVKALAAWQAKNADRAKDDAGLFMRGYQQALEQDGEMLPIADRLLPLLEAGASKKEGQVFDQTKAQELGNMIEQLAGMKKAQRKSVYRSIAARIEAAGYAQKGFWSQMLGELDKGLYRMEGTLGTSAGIAADVATAVAGAQTRIPDTFDGSSVSLPVLSDEEQQALLRQRDYRERIGNVQEEIMQIVSGELDPVKPTTGWMNETLETGLIKGPGAVAPFMAASALLGPYGAGLVFTADFAEQNRRELVQSGLDADQARKVGVMAAPLQAAVESLSNMVSLGKFPAVQAALPRFTRPVGGASLVGRYVQNSLISGATEFTEEQIQDNLVVPAMQELLGALEKDVPEVDWSFYKTRAANATPELAATLLPMALVFGGVMTAADARLSDRMTSNVDALTALNYSQAQATEIVQEKTPEARIAKAASLWRSRAGNKTSLEKGAAKLAERLKALSGDAVAYQAELERRGVLPRVMHTAENDWLLTFNDGSTARFGTHDEASTARWTWAEDQLGRVHALTREVLSSMERNMSTNRELGVEFKPDVRMVEAGQATPDIQRRVEQGKVLGDIDPNEAFDTASMVDRATAEADGFLSSYQILGSSRNEFKDGVLRTTIKLWEGSNVLTLVEEKLEGDAKAIVASRGGRGWMLAALRNYEQESGDKVFREVPDDQLTDDDLVEAWSHLGQSYLVGRSSFGEPLQQNNMRRFSRLLMRAGLAGALNSESTFWQAVVNRAQKLGELKAAGKLNEDVVAELEKQLGIDSQVKHEQGAMQEAQKVANEVAQQVDTSGYSEANPGPNGETFSLRVTPAQDAEYMAAVEAGDMEKAQRMVDEAAKSAGYKSASVIHSTNAEFNSFGRVRWVSTIKGRSEVITPIKSTGIGLIYATQDSAYSALFGDKQLKLYHNISNPADLRSLGSRNVSDSAFDATLSTLGIAHKSSSMGAAPVFERLNKGQHKKAMLEAGFDGFALRERSGDLEADAIAGFDSSQFKSADPVTRDDAGNVIPLSQRFNPADDRITYSIRPGDFASRAIPADSSKVVQMPDGARLVGPTTFSIAEYAGKHRPNSEGPRAFDLLEGGISPADVYQHPEWYSAMEPKVIRETMAQLRRVKGNPKAKLTIYRAGPKGEMNGGDWVSLSKEYARTHAESQDPEGFKVWQAQVSADSVRWSLDDLAEFGYFGETVAATDSGETFSIRAYHGTPHKVDKFTTAKIGTGEGAQAYGWGLYFAESESVAKQYRTILSARDNNLLLDGSPIAKTTSEEERESASDKAVAQAFYAPLLAGKTPEEARIFLLSMRKDKTWTDALTQFDTSRLSFEKDNTGNLYTVELLPDESEFLDWDKPLGQQSDKVDLVNRVMREITGQDEYFQGVPADMPGSWLYHRLAKSLAQHQGTTEDFSSRATLNEARAASEALARIGIPGIKYLDAGSRGAGDGTRNYVIFDENLVRILEENGKPVAQETFSLRVTPAQDAEYMAAVEAGDMEKAQRMVDEAAKAAIESNPRNAVKLGRFLSKSEYESVREQIEELPREVFYVGNVEVIRNPTGDDIRGMTNEERSARGGRRSVDPDTRFTKDNYGNTWRWKATGGMHSMIEPSISRREGVEVNQNNGTPYHSDLVKDAIRSGEYIPSSTLSEYPNYADFVKPSSADPVTRDDAGNVIPLSERFNPVDNRITFSLRPGDFSARMAAKFSLFQAKPELRLAIAQVAKERALRLGAEWIAKGDVIRSAKDIGKEARMREALAYEARMNEYLDGLSENARQTLEFEPSALEDDPLVAAMLDFGKLMSFTTAKKSGKVEAKSGDYDGQPWLPPAWFSKGAGIMPDQMAQAMFDAGMLPDAYTGTLWSELEKRIEATRKDKAAHREAVQAYKAAEKYARDASRAEADQWAENAKKQAGSPKAQRDMLKAALRTLDGILAAAPPEVRARVGGYVKLAGLATDEAMLQEIERRIDKLNVELEKYLKKQAVAEITKLFKKARPDMEAGKKGKGKDADMHALFAAAEAAADMDALAVAGRLADLDARIASGELTSEQEALAMTERGIVELVGDLKNADSGRAFSALDTLRDIYGGAWLKWKIAEIERKERRAGLRQDFIEATGKAGVRTERTKADKVNESLFGKGKAWLLNLSSMREVLAYAFGLDNERVTSLVDAERTASNTYEDANQRLGDEIEGLFTAMAGTRTKGERLRWNLSQRTIKTGKGELSQLEAIQALLMWRQEDGRRHMEGTRDESGKVTSSWSYDQAWIDEIEAALTPEARQVMSFIMGKYAAEWATLNPLYRARYGVNMPHHDAYAPITVTPVQTKAGEVVDPVTGSAVSGGSILTPGSLRTRSRNAIAEPDFRDALQTMILHSRQMEYWKAYYDLAVEMNAVLGNREVMNSVHAKGGKEAANALRQWIDVIGQGGFRDASLRLALFQAGSKLQGRAVGVALLGRMSTILVQSTQLAAAAVKMPVTSYLVRLAKLMTGGLGWRDAMRSDFIQRRFKTAPPIVRQAMDSLASAKPNEIQQLSRFFGNVLSGADAFFTSGTYAILLDYHREQGRAAGLTGAELDAYAHTEAERATEQVAQPLRTANRSLAELSNTGPLGKIGWAFASEARQKVALAAHAALNAKNDPVTAAKSAFLTFAIGGLFSQVLKNLLREAKGDDDREMWSLGRLGYAMTIAPLASAIPFGSAIAGDSNMLSNIQRAIQTLGNEEVDFRDVDAMLSAAGLFNDTAASLAQLSHLGLDLGKILSNAAD